MAVVVMLGRNMRALQAVRDAVNRRAAVVGASDTVRRRAVAKALHLVQFGHSTGWAVSEACRQLAGTSPTNSADTRTG